MTRFFTEFEALSKKSLWSFIPVNERKNMFYIKNAYTGSYLASAEKKHLSDERRVLQMKRWVDSSTLWSLKRSELDEKKFSILNVEYNEPLYAGSYFVIFHIDKYFL